MADNNVDFSKQRRHTCLHLRLLFSFSAVFGLKINAVQQTSPMQIFILEYDIVCQPRDVADRQQFLFFCPT